MTITLDQPRTSTKPALAEKCGEGVKFEKSVIIDRPISEVYSFWRDLENLPSFMKHLESVTLLNDPTTYWVVRSSAKHLWGWAVELTEDRVDELIAWRSAPDSDIHNVGSVSFSAAPGGRGTLVKLTQAYTPPNEPFVASVAGIFVSDSQRSMGGDLERIKILLEGPKVPVTSGQPHGQREPIYSGRLQTCQA